MIIPTYNRLEKLKNALKSALDQGDINLEVIIVDDGSTDGTEEFFKTYKNPLVRYFRKENEGLPALARNFGATKAQGAYLAFLDSDDTWFNKKLRVQVDTMRNDPDILFCYGQGVAEIGEKEIKVSGRFFKKSGNIFYPLMFRNFIVTSSVLIKRDVFEKMSGFPIDQDLPIAEDLKLWLKVSMKGHGKYINFPIVRYDLGNGGISEDITKRFDCLYKVLDWGMIENKTPQILRSIILNVYWMRRYMKSYDNISILKCSLERAIEYRANFMVISFYRLGLWKAKN